MLRRRLCRRTLTLGPLAPAPTLGRRMCPLLQRFLVIADLPSPCHYLIYALLSVVPPLHSLVLALVVSSFFSLYKIRQ